MDSRPFLELEDPISRPSSRKRHREEVSDSEDPPLRTRISMGPCTVEDMQIISCRTEQDPAHDTNQALRPHPSTPLDYTHTEAVASPPAVPAIRVYIPSERLKDFKAYIESIPEHVLFCSYGPSVSPLDSDCTATLSFETIPEVFKSGIRLANTDASVSIQLPQGTLKLSVDRHFYGLTVLNCEENPTVDLVAVTGLGGHAFGSWKVRGMPDMWLRDYLPEDLRKQGLHTRIMIYGYDSKLAGSRAHATLHDYATQFLEALKSARSTDVEKRRPLIFLGHSFGGLIIKHALKEAARGDSDDNIFDSCYALLFFGVPNRGMDITTLQTMVKGQPNDQLVNDLGVKSQVLPELERQFYPIFHKDSRVISFYEKDSTPTAEHVNGRWQRSGPAILMVHHYSATYGTIGERIPDQLLLDGDHSSIVKFARKSLGYLTVRRRISELVKEAPTAIEDRFGKIRKPCLEPAVRSKQIATKEEQDFLKSLSFLRMDSRRNAIKDALEDNIDDACHWLFKHHTYQDWLTRKNLIEHHGILWVKGKPGAGKSTLMEHSLQHIEEYFPSDAILSFFFNARGEHLEKSPDGLFRSLLHQLSQFCLLPKRCLDTFRKREDTRESWEWHQNELRGFFKEGISNLRNRRIFIFVDALDECEEESVREIVSFFEALASSTVNTPTTLSICLSSRHYPNIRVKKCLEIWMENENEADISEYIQRKLLSTYEGEPSSRLGKDIFQKASGVFLWVVLVVRMLIEAEERGESIDGMQHILQHVPKGLDTLFEQIINIIGKVDFKKPLKMMQLVLFAQRSLTPLELCHAVHFCEKRQYRSVADDGFKRVEYFIRHWSGGLIEVKRQDQDSYVQFIHESVRDFLMGKSGLKKFSSSLNTNPIGESQNQLCLLCIEYINITELDQIDWKGGFEVSFRNSFNDELFTTYPFLNYAVTSLFKHAEQAEADDIHQGLQLIKHLHGNNEHLLQFWRYLYDYSGKGRISETYGASTTLFHMAAEYNIHSCVTTLLDCGIDVNIRGGRFETALNAAAYREHLHVVKLLLKNGAKVYLFNKEYRSSLLVSELL